MIDEVEQVKGVWGYRRKIRSVDEIKIVKAAIPARGSWNIHVGIS